MEEAKTVSRRRHSEEFKAEVVAACRARGASVAAVALSHGLNANLVHRWLRLERRARQEPLPMQTARGGVAHEFIALQLPQPVQAPQPEIRIELRRGATSVTVSWPLQGAGECATWLREWLK
ncbi:IS66-like element accessory protein TnpA [Caldimonas tepidiphila]|uniref:IS66-like element accessory protein TnpA n=1 Tax=Caldimonas tepidiphila TaxID=2315841 RepID=UPI000E5C3B20|nr:transposase [Caldimonas tepidiphila]